MSNDFIHRDEFSDGIKELRQTFQDGLERVAENVKEGLAGVNARLDTVNGRIYRHEGQIAANEARISEQGRFIKQLGQAQLTLTPKAKAVVAGAGGVSVLAVLHSLFEMVRAIGPQLGKLFGH